MRKPTFDFDFSPGKVGDFLNHIDRTLPLTHEDNVVWLSEDCYWISYSDWTYIIDVDWYPSMNPEGSFTVRLVDNPKGSPDDEDWVSPYDKPLLQRECRTLEELEVILKEFHEEVLKKLAE